MHDVITYVISRHVILQNTLFYTELDTIWACIISDNNNNNDAIFCFTNEEIVGYTTALDCDSFGRIVYIYAAYVCGEEKEDAREKER